MCLIEWDDGIAYRSKVGKELLDKWYEKVEQKIKTIYLHSNNKNADEHFDFDRRELLN